MEDRRHTTALRASRSRTMALTAIGLGTIFLGAASVPTEAYEAYHPELGVLTFAFVAIRQTYGSWPLVIPALLYTAVAMVVRVYLLGDSAQLATAIVLAHLFASTICAVVFVVLSRRHTNRPGGFFLALLPAAAVATLLPALLFVWATVDVKGGLGAYIGASLTWAAAGFIGVLLFAPVGLFLVNPWAAATESQGSHPARHGIIALTCSVGLALLVGTDVGTFLWGGWMLLAPLLYASLLAGPRWVAGCISLIALVFAYRYDSGGNHPVWVNVLASQVALVTTGVALPLVALAVNAQQRYFQRAQAALKLAKRDALTGVWNRHALDAVLEQHRTAALASRTHCAVIYLDIDQFKPLNDEYGHAAGDAVLRDFGVRLQANVRDSDDVIRLGGDEFLVVLDGVKTDADVEVVITAINSALTIPFRVTYQQDVTVTASSGYALQQKGEAASDVVARADQMLYGNKASRAQHI